MSQGFNFLIDKERNTWGKRYYALYSCNKQKNCSNEQPDHGNDLILAQKKKQFTITHD